MREILFRGKRIDSSKWVQGDYGKRFRKSCNNTYHFINTRDIENSCGTFSVYPETVGQYTGLTDKNGTKIFEGDILKIHQFLFDGCECEKEITGSVEYCYEVMAFCLKLINAQGIKEYMGYDKENDVPLIPICNFYGLHEESFKVIGNIHDNHELLKGV